MSTVERLRQVIYLTAACGSLAACLAAGIVPRRWSGRVARVMVALLAVALVVGLT